MIENQQQIINKLMELNDKQMYMIKVLEDKINNTINKNIMTFAEATKNDIKETLINNIIHIVKKTIKLNNTINDNNKSVIFYNIQNINEKNVLSRNQLELNNINKILQSINIQSKIINIHRVGKYIDDDDTSIYTSIPVKITLESENYKNNIISNAFKLKDTNFKHIGISLVYSKDELSTIKKLSNEAIEKSVDGQKFKLKINGFNFRIVDILNNE